MANPRQHRHPAHQHPAAWRRLRRHILTRDGFKCQWPGCGVLLRNGRTHPHAAVIDHKIRAEIRPDIAFDPDNLWALCKHHHDSAKQSEERRGYSTAIGPDGWPVDASHPFYRAGGG